MKDFINNMKMFKKLMSAFMLMAVVAGVIGIIGVRGSRRWTMPTPCSTRK